MSAQRKQRNTHPPTLTVFAGPNGSGKTTLTNRLLTENRLGILVNADQIAERLAQVGGKLTATTEMQIQAAKAAEEMRWELLNQGASFTTETVMSDHSRWIRFFEAAHERGYLMSLIFVTTSDPAINIGRVSQRVCMGGHSVDIHDAQLVIVRGLPGSGKSTLAREIANAYELLHPMRCKGWSFTGRVNPRLGQFLAGY